MRKTFYWSRMDANIAKYIKQCRICTQYKATQAMQPMIPRDIPVGPWQDLATDVFKHKNTEYLIIADTFSKNPFIYRTTSKTADTIIQKFKMLISQYGSPKRLSIDKGPPLPSETFANFLLTQRNNHVTSSPHYPQSNGFIE